MPSLRHCLVSSPWPQKSSHMSTSLPRKKATKAHPPMRWVPFHLTSKHRFSELIETFKPPRIIHGIWFPHRQCQDIQIIGLALGPVMKCESLEFYNMDTKNPRTPDSIPYLQVRISHGVIWSPSQISLEAIVDAMNPGDFPMAMVVIQGLPELGV